MEVQAMKPTPNMSAEGQPAIPDRILLAKGTLLNLYGYGYTLESDTWVLGSLERMVRDFGDQVIGFQQHIYHPQVFEWMIPKS